MNGKDSIRPSLFPLPPSPASLSQRQTAGSSHCWRFPRSFSWRGSSETVGVVNPSLEEYNLHNGCLCSMYVSGRFIYSQPAFAPHCALKSWCMKYIFPELFGISWVIIEMGSYLRIIEGQGSTKRWALGCVILVSWLRLVAWCKFTQLQTLGPPISVALYYSS